MSYVLPYIYLIGSLALHSSVLFSSSVSLFTFTSPSFVELFVFPSHLKRWLRQFKCSVKVFSRQQARHSIYTHFLPCMKRNVLLKRLVRCIFEFIYFMNILSTLLLVYWNVIITFGLTVHFSHLSHLKDPTQIQNNVAST